MVVAVNLYPFQLEGAKFLAHRGVALLADEPGLGKTVQAIQAVNELLPSFDRLVHVCVMCPASVRENWFRHVMALGGTADWCIDSYDMAAKLEARAPIIDILILDEAHYLKNRRAKRTTAIYGTHCDRADGLADRARYVFLLTGTPVPNDPSELWTHMRALFPGSISSRCSPRPMNYFEFENHFCKVRTDFWGHRHIEGGRNLMELRLRLSPHTLRRVKADVLPELPSVRFSMLPLTVSPADVRRIAKEAGEGTDVDEILRAGPGPTLRRFTGLAKVEPMVAWLKDWFAGGGGKLVLFAYHREVIEKLVDSFPAISVKLMGDVSPLLKQEAIDLFQNDQKRTLFVGQLQAAGTGITLTAASTAILVESSWVPAENEQAAMRIHRIGQHDACDVRFAHAAGTIDERIQAAAMRKMETIKQMFSTESNGKAA